MNSERLNEHDANQGAQSKGEFLGMTGNSAWYLLGAAGASILLIIVLWGVLGFSLLVCLALGATLCALSVGYVFALKNNRPEHYDTDFFESALIEAGVVALAFGPNPQRPMNPFRSGSVATESDLTRNSKRSVAAARSDATKPVTASPGNRGAPTVSRPRQKDRREVEEVRTVPLADYQRLREERDEAEDALEDALVACEEEGV